MKTLIADSTQNFAKPGILRTWLTRFGCLFAASLFLLATSAQAAITVTASSPGGQKTQTLPDAGGPFDLNLPLQKNAVNTITVTATDTAGHKASQELKVTQLSLNAVVVSKVTAERMSTEQVKQLVADGVIKLDNPENYNVSKFDLVLTIGTRAVPISVTVPVPVTQEVTGVEHYQIPQGGGGGGGEPQVPDCIIFEQTVAVGGGGGGFVSIPGVILIEGKIKSLKEFYTVRLLLMNTSGIFTLKDVMANISFPHGGLSSIAPADGVISFGDILPGDGGEPGQAERQFIIRGDEIGVQPVDVGFGGTIAGPGIDEDKAIPFNGSASTEVEVKGPPTFLVKATHPATVVAGSPYEFKVDITNTGEVPALYASLALDVGGGANLVRCDPGADPLHPVCQPIEGSDIRNFGDILPGQSASATFLINPHESGPVTSCVGVADQNITMQVQVGSMGCLVGQFPPEEGVPDGVPTVAVAPTPNTLGVGLETPVTAFFSQSMNPGSIWTGEGGSFNVYDSANNRVPGTLTLVPLADKTVAVWQVLDNATNRWAPNTEYTVYLTQAITNENGVPLFHSWTSRFTSTGTKDDDHTAPTLSLTVMPPVLPTYVLPGQLVTIDAYAADQGSGVARTELRIKDLSLENAPYQLVDRRIVFNGDLPPYLFTIDSGNLVPGHTYELMGTAYDAMMNQRDATIDLVIATSADAPTITLPAPPVEGIPQGISVSVTPVAITGGVREVRYYLDSDEIPFKTVNLPPYQAGLSTLTLSLGDHTLRAVAEDGLAQTGEATYAFTLVSNPNKPLVTLTGATSGATYLVGSSFVVSGTATDPVGIQSLVYRLDGTPIALPSGAQSLTIATAGLSLGAHQLVAQAVNALGVPGTTALDFVVAPLPNGPPPPAPGVTDVSAPSNGQVTLSGTSSAGARIDITNGSQQFIITVNANGSGAFTAGLAASSGDSLRLVAYDFTTSQQPSPATVVTVPAPPVLDHIDAAMATASFTAANQYSDVVITGTYQGGTTANLTAQTAFSSSDPTVAAVNAAGRVVALKSGSAVITATVAGKQAQVAVTVNIVTLVSVTVDPTTLTFPVLAQTRQLTVTGHYSDGSLQALTPGVSYISGELAVTQVTPTGLVTAKANGATQITVSCPGVAPVPVAVTVDTSLDTPPQVQILSPASGTAVQRGDLVTVHVEASDAVGGISRLDISVVGPNSQQIYVDTLTIPQLLTAPANFTFTVPDGVPLGGTVTVTVGATDTGGHTASPSAVVMLTVVDTTAPVVNITAPEPQTAYNYGDTVTLTVHAIDRGGVARVAYETTGALSLTGSSTLLSPTPDTTATFSIPIPYGTPSSDLQVVAHAYDVAGNAASTSALHLIVTGADITPPATEVVAINDPQSSVSTTVTYQVTDGLADLDHVELYFRRNGIGSFNLYAGPAGDGDGRYGPSAQGTGTVAFDSTRTGGDGTFEFYTVGVDKAGNREPPPKAGYMLAASYSFNGSALDDSENGNRGSSRNGASLVPDRFGRVANAYQFNGSNQYIDVADADSLDVTTDFTLAAWIRPDGPMQDPAQGGIISKVGGGGGNNGYQMGVTGGNTQLWCMFNAAGEAWGSNKLLTSDTPVPSSQWSHVACTYDHQTLRLYLNGELKGSLAVGPKSVAKTTSHLRVSSDDNGNAYFNGAVDDVVISRRALATQEISGLAQIGAAGVAADGVAVFNAGTVWSVVSADTTLSATETGLDDKNVRVVHSTLTVNGSHSFRNVELLSGAVLTHSAATAATEPHLDVTAWSVAVDSTSSINVDARGYLGGNQPGNDCTGQTLGNVDGSTYHSGGSYGGTGGPYDGTPARTYGSMINPAALGSGGSCGGYSYMGGSGGGWVALRADSVGLDGAISANGATGTGYQSGSGSGGTVNLNVRTLSGRAPISANGGVGEVGGGGGRIAVGYLDISTMNTAQIQALGGQGGIAKAGNGTVFLHNSTGGSGTLVVDGQGASSPYTLLPIPAGYVFDGIRLRNNARVVADAPIVVTQTLSVSGGSILTHSVGSEAGLSIQARRVEVDETSSIDVSGKGYRGGSTVGNSSCTAVTLGGLPGATSLSGGSYGGYGGVLGAGSHSNSPYGQPSEAFYLGSGGACGGYNYAGGNGGGLLRIVASDAVVVNGTLVANGGDGTGYQAGSGSGGSIRIETSLLQGTGLIAASGGAVEVGGGGGRVSLVYDYLGGAGQDFAGLRNISAFGGHGGNRWGGAGTVLLRQRSGQFYGDLYVDDNITGATSSVWTPLTPVGLGKIAGLTADTLTTSATINAAQNGLAGAEINPNLSKNVTYRVVSNTTTTITVDITGKPSLPSVASVGDAYAGVYRFDNVRFRRGGFLVTGDLLIVDDTMEIVENGQLTHYNATMDFEPRLDLTVGALEVGGNGSINVDGRGYLGGGTGGNDCTGQTLGNVDGATSLSGGSYGGLGGRNGGTSNGTGIYGSMTDPAGLGSGGSCGGYQYAGGNGGGWVFIHAGSVTVDGTISANGTTGAGYQAGSGSGGTINLVTTTLSGGGTVSANGGAYEVGGGGGRIAVHYGSLGMSPDQLRVVGGVGGNASGGNGTLFLKSNDQVHGDFIVDGRNLATPGDSTPLPSGYVFDSMTLRNHARVVADTPIVVTGTLSMTGGSVLTHSVGSEAGLSIQAKRVEVDETSSMDVSTRGYRGGARDGNQGCRGVTLGGLLGANYHAGGSYGGYGGIYDGTGSNPPYGQPSEAFYLGSGGSCGGYNYAGGNGGGLVQIAAGEAVVLNGRLLANGGTGDGYQAGSGSGGSISIETPLLQGTGVIAANGGVAEVGGGGGRVSIVYDFLGEGGQDLGGLLNVSAFGGHGNYGWGSAGTVFLRKNGQAHGDLYFDDNLTSATSTAWSPLTPVGFGKITALTANTLVGDGGIPWAVNGLAGAEVEVKPNTGQAVNYRVLSNTANTLTLDISGKNDLLEVSSIGDAYAGVYRFDNVTFRRGGYLVLGDRLLVGETMTVGEHSRLTHYDATMGFEPRLDLTVGTLEVSNDSSINVDGRGYLGGNRGGNDCTGQWLGNVDGATYQSGGSYGGLGGRYSGTSNGTGVYGSATDPAELGAGGACGGYAYAGGDGGGWVSIHAGSLNLDGAISAVGATGTGYQAGSGSGGTVNLVTSTFTGIGTVNADGGGGEVGGGGGRIAFQCDGTCAFQGNVSASRGVGSNASGNDGTIHRP